MLTKTCHLFNLRFPSCGLETMQFFCPSSLLLIRRYHTLQIKASPLADPIMAFASIINGYSMLLPLTIISTFIVKHSAATDTLLPNQSISDGQTLVSAGYTFELGFFSPSNSSSNRYVGIWYHKIPEKTVVWVANRNSPIADTSGMLRFNSDGSLMTLDRRGSPTILTFGTMTNNAAATILDSGNLVLRDINNSSLVFWQSFDYLTDTFLPGMKLGFRGRQSWLLTSWRSSDDPSPGDFSLGANPNGMLDFSIWQKNNTYWNSGVWNGHGFSLVPEMTANYNCNYAYVTNNDEAYFTYSVKDDTIISRLVMSISGQIQQLAWVDASQEWILFWSQPRTQCDVYNLCGSFGTCNEQMLPFCGCMGGFEPGSSIDWSKGVTRGGCVRTTRLQCGGRGEPDRFLSITHMEFPVDGQKLDVGRAKDCESACLNNCSCTAYAVSGGCKLWYGNLIHLKILDDDVDGVAETLYIRLAASELRFRGHHHVIVKITASLGSVILCSLVCFLRIRRRRRRHRGLEQSLSKLDADFAIKLRESKESNSEFSLFNISTIEDATDNFSHANKLGEGGFGPVYKGQLPEGQEIAIKRLAACSRQGLQEFKNEILLIAKLQHRNLVRLLGCCIQGEEKLLIYEYMPNKSLDFFLFDPARGAQLDWQRRFHIIEGIAQGLLYLHKHSRVRIIHRDLKASNILLDSELNPKISDFGIARMFGSNETQANTIRVVGTYGYMSPEYAREGLFSIKSDVFSFGVLLLEIVSGKRNAGFHQYGISLNLLGYAWELWKEGKWLELMDPLLGSTCPTQEVSRCIHIGLMCVQESAADRPTMSDVITMLSSESAALPDPKQPAFFTVRITTEAGRPSNRPETFSLNDVTITVVDGR